MIVAPILSAFPNAQPVAGLMGGALIGLAAAIMLLGGGRIAGVSGMLARATGMAKTATPWGVATIFVLGLVIGGLFVDRGFGAIEARFTPSVPLLIAAGLLVGIGTRIGSGCTSGHGVCGMARLSPRSLIATVIFMGAAIATVAIVNAIGPSEIWGAWA